MILRTACLRALGAALLIAAGPARSQATQLEQAPGPLRSAPPRAVPPRVIDAPPPVAPSGTATAESVQVTLQAVRIEGATTVAPERLAASLGEVAGRRFDLGGLRALAAAVQRQLRDAGLPFARAFLPAQDLAGGVLRIQVVEGHYGQVVAMGEEAAALAPWLRRLAPGQAIESAPLERTLLLLQQLPGVDVNAVLRPGARPGEGDLAVQASLDRRAQGELGVDNHGTRHAGRARVRASVAVHGPFAWGDRLQGQASVTEQGTWLGNVAYAVPLGTDGWRANLTAGRSQYQLGKDFAALDARGTADSVAIAFSHPLWMSPDARLAVSAGWQHKRLRDQQGAFGLDERKRSDAWPLALSADLRDDRGVSWGVLGVTPGRMRLDDSLRAADATTAGTQGGFTRANLDLARLQQLSPAWTVLARVSRQWAGTNLDPSEKFVLGGVNGVRAWPNGEAVGDGGWLVQLELRWRHGGFEPYLFADGGGVRFNQSPWTAGINHRKLSGAGFGLRLALDAWTAEASLGWRGTGGSPVTEPSAGQPQVWMAVGRRF